MSTAIEAIQGVANIQDINTVYGASTRPVQLRRAGISSPSESSTIADVAFPENRAQEAETERTREADDVKQVVDDTNHQLGMQNRALRFRIDSENDVVQIQVVDKDRERVIRTIPSDEMVRLASRMRELSGIGAMVDQSR